MPQAKLLGHSPLNQSLGQVVYLTRNKTVTNFLKSKSKLRRRARNLKSGNFLLDFLDAEDLHGDGVTVSVMLFGVVKMEEVGG